MPKPLNATSELRQICLDWSEALDAVPSQESRIDHFESALPELLLDTVLIRALLSDISTGRFRTEQRHGMMFDNEILLYMDARRRFSLRMYLHEPGQYTTIHDHSSWGVLGNASGTMEIIKYRLMDDDKRDGFARIEEAARITCRPGHTDTTLPLDEGIHCVGNPTANAIAIVNVYGSPLRRLYINHFDRVSNRVEKIFPPHLRKKNLAAQALAAFDKANAEI